MRWSCLEGKKQKGDLTTVIHHLWRAGEKVEPDSSWKHIARGNRHKLQQGKFWLERKMFTMGIARPWNQCMERWWALCPGKCSWLSWTSPRQSAPALQVSPAPRRGWTGDLGAGTFCPKLLFEPVIHGIHVHEIFPRLTWGFTNAPHH